MTDAVRESKRRKRVHTEWAEWLGNLPWDHYATLTFDGKSDRARKEAKLTGRSKRTPEEKAIQIGPDAARGMFSYWVRRLTQDAGLPLFWFVVLEDGALLGRIHIHCLIGNTRELLIETLSARWKFGFSRISLYDPERDAKRYVTKYVIKALTQYDMSPNLERALAARAHQQHAFRKPQLDHTNGEKNG